MFLDYIKLFFVKKSIKKHLKNTIHSVSKDKIKSVGVLIDEDNFKNISQLEKLLANFGFTLQVLTFRNKWEKDTVSKYQKFGFQDFDFFGNLKSVDIQQFADSKFDMLVSYYDNQNFPLQLLTAKSKAQLKTGFSDNELNQLMIDTQLNKETVFVDELKKYLTLLNKI